MTANKESYEKGELVPRQGKYRCTGSGETWIATEAHVRFPPCEVCKTGDCRWELVEER